MPRFIRIQQATGHAAFVSTDEMRAEIDVRSNPIGGYTDVDRCMALIQNPEPGHGYTAFPCSNALGALTFHVEGLMDVSRRNLRWKEPGHRCTPLCLLEPAIQIARH